MMLKNKDKLIREVVNGFQENRGRASVYCFNHDVIPELIYNIIKPFSTKNPNDQIFIVVNEYETRKAILDFIKSKNETYNLRILSYSYINTKYSYYYKLIILAGLNDHNESIFNHLAINSRFLLNIITEVILNNYFIEYVRERFPIIQTADYDTNIRKDDIYSPVEETLVLVNLSDEDIDKYEKFTDYINTSVSIFGTLDNIEKCKKGDSATGVSAAEFRNNIANNNGWNENLDMTLPFMKQIDAVYNPNVLYERACNFYNITKARRDLLSDNIAKLEVIKNICENNKDKQILIVSSKGEFAAKITNYINNNTSLICGDYHDCIDPRIAIDDNGDIITIKSGKSKGKPRMLGSQAQSTLNEARFNNKTINVLSIKFSSNIKLKIACDMIILTSPLFGNIIDVKTRFKDIKFNGEVTETYRIYCNNTIEADKLMSDNEQKMIKVLNDKIL